jgi:hypothetical protein
MQQTLVQFLVTAICLFLIWRIYKVIQHHPEVFSKAAISKSFTTMGVIALILIGAVAMMVMLVRG